MDQTTQVTMTSNEVPSSIGSKFQNTRSQKVFKSTPSLCGPYSHSKVKCFTKALSLSAAERRDLGEVLPRSAISVFTAV